METKYIAIISDTHELGTGWGSPQKLLKALHGSDLILHCGDLEVLGILDHLETIAPVLAVRGYGDPHESGHRLAEQIRVTKINEVRIGMVHDIWWPGPAVSFNKERGLAFPKGGIREIMERKFKHPVDVVCFGDTHETYVNWHDGILFLNPGSPTHPSLYPSGSGIGTLAYLAISGNKFSAKIKTI
jgi:putative phosphoesterase